MRDDRQRLLDILDAVEKIEKYIKNGRDSFEKDELIQTWMIHHILILGEAVANLSKDFCESHHEIPWRQIIAMRNLLVHVYFNIDNTKSYS